MLYFTHNLRLLLKWGLITVTLVTKWNKVIGVQHVESTTMLTFWVSRRCISSTSSRVSWRHLVVGTALHACLAILDPYILAKRNCRIVIHSVSMFAQAWTVSVMVHLCPLEQVDACSQVVVVWNNVDINSAYSAFQANEIAWYFPDESSKFQDNYFLFISSVRQWWH